MGAQMFERIKALVEKWRDLKEVDGLTDRDLDDLGMSRDQVQRFVRMPTDIADRVGHMAAIFGLDAADLQRNQQAYIDLLETCGTCTARAACSRVLDMGAAAKPEDCSFCRNAANFAAA
jgi:uncharacterized protein YjiS (DUF1127 family)